MSCKRFTVVPLQDMPPVDVVTQRSSTVCPKIVRTPAIFPAYISFELGGVVLSVFERRAPQFFLRRGQLNGRAAAENGREKIVTEARVREREREREALQKSVSLSETA